MPPLNLRSRSTSLSMILLALFALQGCFHNDDDPAPPTPPPVVDADPTGYYTNTGFVQVMMADNTTPRTTTADFQGMVTGNQFTMQGDTDNLTYVGTFTVSGNELSGTVTLYEAGEVVQGNVNVPLSGMITATSTITGTLGGTGAANGTFKLDYAADNGPVDMSMVVRGLSWEPVTGSPPDLPFVGVGDEIASIPNFVSSISGGGVFNSCDYDGRIEPIPDTHLYSVSVTVSTCVNSDLFVTPMYTGLVSVRSDVDANDRMIVVLTNGAYDFSGEYRAR